MENTLAFPSIPCAESHKRQRNTVSRSQSYTGTPLSTCNDLSRLTTIVIEEQRRSSIVSVSAPGKLNKKSTRRLPIPKVQTYVPVDQRELLSVCPMGNTVPWTFSDTTPPPHSRTLFAPIPLPDVDEVSTGTTCAIRETHGTVPMESIPWIWCPSPARATVHLHKLISNACFFPRPLNNYSRPRALKKTYSPSVRNAQSTWPAMGSVTLILSEKTIHILPKSFVSPNVVTVGDVLDMIEAQGFFMDQECHGQCQWGNTRTVHCRGRLTFAERNVSLTRMDLLAYYVPSNMFETELSL